MYLAGSLVGLVMSNDIPSFCDPKAAFIEIGDTTGCPREAMTWSLDCSRDGGAQILGGGG
jgi:hypothetical protein